MPKELIPMGNNVLVEPIPVSDTVKFGDLTLARAETYKTPSGQAKVVSCGPGRPDYTGRMVPIDLAVGDVIVFNWINGREINLEGRALKLLDAAEILGKFRKV